MPVIPSEHEFLESDYKKFLDKYREIHSTEFYMETYPGLDVEIETEGWNKFMLRNMNRALELYDPTYVLQKYIEIALDSPRYICQNEGEEPVRLVKLCLSAGASFPDHMLFSPKYQNEGDVEDEVQNHNIRALLIHNFKDFIQFPDEWRDLPAVSWEESYKDGDDDDPDTAIRIILSNLKYEVKLLSDRDGLCPSLLSDE